MALVDYDVAGPVATITLADVERRNVLSAPLVAELLEALDAVEADASVRVAVVTNRGRAFCAGADLAASAPGAARVDLPGVLTRIQRSAKPFVGRLAGHCVAGGVGLAAAMDVSIALEDATFGFSEVRLGLAPAVISVVCLPKLRRGDALDAFLRGRRFSAGEAAAMGLINAVAAEEDLDAAVLDVVTDLLAGEPGALAAAKALVYEVPTLTRDAAFAFTAELTARLFASEAAREGMAAFLEKRPPAWVVAPPDPPWS